MHLPVKSTYLCHSSTMTLTTATLGIEPRILQTTIGRSHIVKLDIPFMNVTASECVINATVVWILINGCMFMGDA